MASGEKKISIRINGIKIEITEEIKRSWYKMINDTRHEAQRNGTCGQADYRRCGGDCALCPRQLTGNFVSYEEAFTTADPAPGPAETAEQADTLERMLAQARSLCEDGDLILTMCMEKLSSHEIGSRLGIPQKTAYHRIRRLLKDLRDYYKENFEFSEKK